MFKIGEFSKMSKVTIKALRYYEKEGIIKPTYIDKINGYRYYESKQLIDIAKIISLKQIGLTINEIVYKDFKSYVTGEVKFGIGQVFTTDFKEYSDRLNEYVDELNHIADNNDYKVACLFVTDILENNSYLLFNDGAKEYLNDAYELSDIKEGEKLMGVISRKKQMVPPIMGVLEKL